MNRYLFDGTITFKSNLHTSLDSVRALQKGLNAQNGDIRIDSYYGDDLWNHETMPDATFSGSRCTVPVSVWVLASDEEEALRTIAHSALGVVRDLEVDDVFVNY